MSEVEKVFKALPKRFNKQNVQQPRTFYFSLDDEKWTVFITKEKCDVKPGKTDNADCFFKGSAQMFLDVWNGKYTPSAKDFLLGTIKSNNPILLKEFIAAFRKS
jgi:putative sterol carrier protein